MTGNSFTIHAHEDQTAREYYHHSSGKRINTDVVLVEAIRRQYPNLDLTVSPAGAFNLLAYASAGYAKAVALDDPVKDPIYGPHLSWRTYLPPPRRMDNSPGVIAERVIFGKYLYQWEGQEFILYLAHGRDGGASYPDIVIHYILSRDSDKVDELLKVATIWGVELHDEIWVFDQGYWQKSRELYESVQKSYWENVILDEGMKQAIISDVNTFFDSRQTYEDLKVPWKRGIIYYGPPGNGKTISIKAMMHMLYQRGKSDNKQTVPTLYVRTLTSFAGPEYSLGQIFAKARQTAPCYLVFEDLDSIVNDRVRSYFLNEVDGIKANDGILMVGSTNHLDRLDPGISKRPSRFDRKYFFPDPDFDQRVQYARFWQTKLKDNKELEFPGALCPAIANITDKFSFAYIQEAFVASLLAIAVSKDAVCADKYSGPQDPIAVSETLDKMSLIHNQPFSHDRDLDKYVLWREIQKQVRILREEMEDKRQVSHPTNGPVAHDSTSETPPIRTTMTGRVITEDLDWVRAQQERWREEMEPDVRNPVETGFEGMKVWGLESTSRRSREQYPETYA